MPTNNVEAQVRQIKQLRGQRDKAQTDVTADEAELRVLEEQRDKLYEECRDLGVEPQDIKNEIEDRSTKLQEDIDRIQTRFDTLTKSEEDDG